MALPITTESVRPSKYSKAYYCEGCGKPIEQCPTKGDCQLQQRSHWLNPKAIKRLAQ